MKYIDIDTWKRKKHFNYFKNLDYPHFNVCGNIDITLFYKYIKSNNLPFSISLLYCIMKSVNLIEEFRYRIREEKVVVHNIVHPSFTVLKDNNVFDFCYVNYNDNYHTFKNETKAIIENSKNEIELDDEKRDDLIFISSVPWISFTSISHPINMNPVDSIPRITTGKYFEEGNLIKLPISVQVHHALMDGFHVGLYYKYLQDVLDNFKDYD